MAIGASVTVLRPSRHSCTLYGLHFNRREEAYDAACSRDGNARPKNAQEGITERTMGMHFSRLLLVVAAALPLGACFLTAEQIAANDDAACRSAGLKPGTPAYVKCREDRSNLRFAQNMEAQAMQRQMWSMQQMNTQLMMRGH